MSPDVLSPDVMTAIQAGVVWLTIELLKKFAPKFWGRHNAVMRVVLVAFGSAALSVVVGIVGGAGVVSILLSAAKTFVGAIFGRQMVKIALPPKLTEAVATDKAKALAPKADDEGPPEILNRPS